jgi:type I restriction enzyme R subunit
MNLKEDMERILEEAELDEEQEKKVGREFTREYHLMFYACTIKRAI